MMVWIERAGVKNAGLLEALRRVPRHAFFSENLRDHAYLDSPIMLESGSRTPSPVLAAQMIELLELKGGEEVLNAGTLTGYEAAVLSLVVGHVYSVELLQELVSLASTRFARHGYSNVTVRCADPMAGWEAHAPFDAILVVECVPEIPHALLNQLKEGGRMVVCLGEKFLLDSIRIVTKEDGKVHIEGIQAERFPQPDNPAGDRRQGQGR
jgi:protein-L-isoaspartate(D-aspartate) O-methyltransferase